MPFGGCRQAPDKPPPWGPRLLAWANLNGTHEKPILKIPPFESVMMKQRICIAADIGFLMALTGPNGYLNNKYFADQYANPDALTNVSYTFPVQQTGQRRLICWLL